ncbi:hypothetical protein SAMN06269185_3258 [Natronoarchaeum philippinense]|uniref:Uncharacterized protein n=1 Tax=Natronoarchaeum philippinense TaxID=558529 RepID=A0A285PE44_NATPI|nr:hypothetical protein [Natronoarchaeum philippinense]SNZ18131.1 hypothetical protein SAMN06269185_3258 [Natronoarchaeum philippinense]
MSEPGLSEDDRKRIEQFLERPAYERDPEQLRPGEREEEEPDGESDG